MNFKPNIINDTKECVDVIKSINYVDSSLFGLSIDVFKIRIMISAALSMELKKFGFNEGFESIFCDFSQIENLDLTIEKSVFGPPYLEDGELAAIDLADFNFKIPEIEKVGVTSSTDRINCYGADKDIYRIKLTFDYGIIQFDFADLVISKFDPRDLD